MRSYTKYSPDLVDCKLLVLTCCETCAHLIHFQMVADIVVGQLVEVYNIAADHDRVLMKCNLLVTWSVSFLEAVSSANSVKLEIACQMSGRK